VTILVCPLSRVACHIRDHVPERIVSLLDPDFDTPASGTAYADLHLRLHFHDIHLPADGQVVASAADVSALLAFVGAWQRSRPLLIHCRAGISRSTAAAYIAACLHNPGADEHEIARTLRQVSPLARPNETLIALADAALGRGGRMSRAIRETGAMLPWIDVYENEPFALPSAYAMRSGI
jgi:predicted protein tyrosine phosphatase